MKKFILLLDLHDDNDKRKALKTVTMLPGIDSISMDMKQRKLTVIGTVDPVSVASKLRKNWQTDIIFVGPAKEPEKKEEPKKEEPKKEEPKKEEAKEEPKKEEEKKEEPKKEEPPKKDGEKKPVQQPVIGPHPGMFMPFRPPYYHPMHAYNPPMPAYNPPMSAYNPPGYTYHPPPMMHTYHPPPNQHYYVQPIEDNPNSCVII